MRYCTFTTLSSSPCNEVLLGLCAVAEAGELGARADLSSGGGSRQLMELALGSIPECTYRSTSENGNKESKTRQGKGRSYLGFPLVFHFFSPHLASHTLLSTPGACHDIVVVVD